MNEQMKLHMAGISKLNGIKNIHRMFDNCTSSVHTHLFVAMTRFCENGDRQGAAVERLEERLPIRKEKGI